MSSSSSNKHLGGGSSSEGNYPHLICKQKNKYIGLVSPQQQLTVNPVPPPLRLAPTTCPRHPLHRVEGWAVTTYEQVLFFRPLVYKKKSEPRACGQVSAQERTLVVSTATRPAPGRRPFGSSSSVPAQRLRHRNCVVPS